MALIEPVATWASYAAQIPAPSAKAILAAGNASVIAIALMRISGLSAMCYIGSPAA